MHLFSLGFAAVLLASCYGDDSAPISSMEPERNPICTFRNHYYSVDTTCDGYVECRDYIAHEMLCPDGLHYNPEAKWPDYPCSYPTEVTCVGRAAPQPAQPTADCPHQYGFFPSSAATEQECGLYRMCVEGQAIEMMCPPGLAFNAETARCDWPDLVASCNAADYLGFSCPDVPLGKDGEVPVINYKFEGSCYTFFSCEGKRARLLSCDVGFAFDSASGKCIDSEKVVCDHPRI